MPAARRVAWGGVPSVERILDFRCLVRAWTQAMNILYSKVSKRKVILEEVMK